MRCRVRLHHVVLGLPLVVLFVLVISVPHYKSKSCPPVSGSLSRVLPGDPALRPVDCGAVMRGDQAEVEYARQFSWCRLSTSRSSGIIGQCGEYAASFYTRPVSTDLPYFPIAFSILIHENVEQFERLLRAVYHPHNVYCVHVDPKAGSDFMRSVAAIAQCLDNVFVASKLVDIAWGEYSLLEAELSCLHELWNHSTHWFYYINLSGREFPLKTNQELVEILRAYNGSNDIDGSLHRRPIVWTQFVWRSENWRTTELKEKPPHGFLIAKGSTHVAASRAFVDFALHDPRAIDLLHWMRDIRAPDEHFFPTLNHNPHLSVPGAYKGDPDLKWFYTRLKVWWNEKGVEECGGQWVRFICNMGVTDLARLTHAPQLFVNKLRLEQDPIAFECVEQWHHNRSLLPNLTLDLGFYRNLNFVKNHV